jgi:hypothetical protein
MTLWIRIPIELIGWIRIEENPDPQPWYFSTLLSLLPALEVMPAKETGHLWLYYIYMTVFIINAANLANILL